MNDDELSELEKKLFLNLKKDFGANDLEDKVVKRLVSENLVVTRRSMPVFKWAAMLLLGASIFIAGRFSGARHDDYRYVLLLHNDDSVLNNPEARFVEYQNWAKKIRESGVAIAGEKLSEEVNWVAPARDRYVDNVISGFFMISTPTEAEAIAIARSSPHVKYKGMIEVRRIVNR